MRRFTKVIVTVFAVASLAVGSFAVPCLNNSPDNVVKAEEKMLRYAKADKLEAGGEYVMLFNTAPGSESDTSKFYSNTGDLAAMQLDSSGIKLYNVKEASYENNRKSVLFSESLKSSLVWKCEAADGGYLISCGGKYIQDGGSGKVTLSTDKTAAGCVWTYKAGKGEDTHDYTPLRSVSGSNVIRISASAAAFVLANPDSKATDSRNSNVYLYKVTGESVESSATPTPEPKNVKPVDERKKLAQILTCSDYQKWYPNGKYDTDDWDALQPQLTEIVNAAYNSGFTSPDYFLFGGDTSCLNSAKSSNEGQRQVMEIVGDVWPEITVENTLMLQGNHDPADTDNIPETGAYEYDNFIVYMINEDDYPTKQGEESIHDDIIATADKVGDYLDTCIDRKETRPIIIASHGGLHYDIDRTDGNNQFAYELFDVINEKALSLDIIFMFGHNHTNGDELVGGSITFIEKGDELGVCHEDSIANKSGTKTKLNFTYMNYGYIGYVGDIHNNASELDVTDILTVSSITIYDDTIEISRYSKNGWESKYDGVITREHAPEPTAAPTEAPTTAPSDNTSVNPSPTPASSNGQNPGNVSNNPLAGATPAPVTGSLTDPVTTTVDKSKEDVLSISSVSCKKNAKQIKGKISVKKATVKIKVGKKAYKKATVKGKQFTFKVPGKLKKNTVVIIKVSKKGYATLTKKIKVK